MPPPLKTQTWPECGFYKTEQDLVIEQVKIEASRLVHFHNHSDQGTPILLIPKDNTNNRWSYHPKGIYLQNATIMNSLVPLKSEGFYRLKEHIHVNENQIVDKATLIQLGYTQKAQPLIFFPKVLNDINGILFSDKGMAIPDKIYELLEPLETRGPYVPKERHLH